MNANEDEQLAGAKMYISEISHKFNTPISQEREKPVVLEADAKKKADDFASKVKSNLNQVKRDHEEQKVFQVILIR